jgi:hypothetical protein
MNSCPLHRNPPCSQPCRQAIQAPAWVVDGRAQSRHGFASSRNEKVAALLRRQLSFGRWGKLSGRGVPASRRVIVRVGCGKVTNRTSRRFPSVRLLHLSSYGAGTRPRLKRHSHGAASDQLICIVVQPRKRKRESFSDNLVSARLTARADRSPLGIDRLRLVCERVKLRR